MLDLNNMNLVQRARNIRLLVLDVDGVLTDGKLYFLPMAVKPKPSAS